MNRELLFDSGRMPATWLMVAWAVAAFTGCDGLGGDPAKATAQALERRSDALDTLKSRGAKVTTKKIPFVGDSVAVDFSGVRELSNDTFALLKEAHNSGSLVSEIDLSNSNVNDEQIAFLGEASEFSNVIKLNLKNTAVSDKGLGDVAKLSMLIDLNVTGTKVTPEGVKAFVKARADNPAIQAKKTKIRQ
ncbi:MAG: hypothetical protein ACT4QC_24350 [Planctomycetaceae bacterium]